LIIRSFSLFLGDYPNEAKTLDQVVHGNIKLSGDAYLYFVLFFALNVAVSYVQHKLYPGLNENS
jgi:hypothetical protein